MLEFLVMDSVVVDHVTTDLAESRSMATRESPATTHRTCRWWHDGSSPTCHGPHLVNRSI